jgi:hypothetical protein
VFLDFDKIEFCQRLFFVIRISNICTHTGSTSIVICNICHVFSQDFVRLNTDVIRHTECVPQMAESRSVSAVSAVVTAEL